MTAFGTRSAGSVATRRPFADFFYSRAHMRSAVIADPNQPSIALLDSDGAMLVFKRTTSTPTHTAWETTADGAKWAYEPDTTINAAAFDLSTDGTAAENSTAWDGVVAYMNASGAKQLKIPPGTYQFNTGAGFNKTNLDIDGEGVTIVINAIDDGADGEVVFWDLNTAATADEAGENIRANVTVHGITFRAAADLVATPNKVTALRVRGLVTSHIRDCRFEDLNVGIDFNPRDGCSIVGNHFFQNNRHVRVEDWQTGVANPQNNWITHNNFSKFYAAGVDVQGLANGLVIRDNEFVGAPGVQVANGVTGFNGTRLVIDSNDMEQGLDFALTGTWTVTSGSNSVTAAADGAATTELAVGDFIRTAAGTVYHVTATPDANTITISVNASATESSIALGRPPAYVDVRDAGKTLFGLVVTNNSFGAFETSGGSTLPPLILHARDVNGLEFVANQVPTTAVSGAWLHLDSACRRIHIARPNFLGLAWASWPAIGYDCSRTDISVDPAIVHFDNDAGLLTGWNPMQLSTGNDGTIDLDSVMGSNWPGILPPVGAWFKGEMKDSGSASTQCEFSLYPDTSINDNDQWQHVRGKILAGTANDEPVDFYGYCPIDDATGTVAYDRVASGANTLEVRLKASALNMGGGRP